MKCDHCGGTGERSGLNMEKYLAGMHSLDALEKLNIAYYGIRGDADKQSKMLTALQETREVLMDYIKEASHANRID